MILSDIKDSLTTISRQILKLTSHGLTKSSDTVFDDAAARIEAKLAALLASLQKYVKVKLPYTRCCI